MVFNVNCWHFYSYTGFTSVDDVLLHDQQMWYVFDYDIIPFHPSIHPFNEYEYENGTAHYNCFIINWATGFGKFCSIYFHIFVMSCLGLCTSTVDGSRERKKKRRKERNERDKSTIQNIKFIYIYLYTVGGKSRGKSCARSVCFAVVVISIMPLLNKVFQIHETVDLKMEFSLRFALRWFVFAQNS